jgi:hypothetical protein
MMLFGPGVKNITVANTMKASRSWFDMRTSRDEHAERLRDEAIQTASAETVWIASLRSQ